METKEIIKKIDMVTADYVDAKERVKEAQTIHEELVAKIDVEKYGYCLTVLKSLI
jgi:hypothetical protein